MKLIKIGCMLVTGVAIVTSSPALKPLVSVSRRDVQVEVGLIGVSSAELHDLEKRKGGGGSSSGGGGGSSGGSRSGSGSSGSGSSGSGGSRSGSGSSGPSYGGGKYYGGGSTTPYRSGGRSPAGLLPFLIVPALIFPGLWLYGAYAYNYNHPYNFLNRTNTTLGQNGSNQTLPVTCLCDQYSACGCDDDNNSTFLDSIIGDGNTANLNSSLVRVSDVNGTKTIVLNGTLPNDTIDSTDSGSSTPSSTSSPTSAANKRFWLETSGFWLLGAIVGATVWLI